MFDVCLAILILNVCQALSVCDGDVICFLTFQCKVYRCVGLIEAVIGSFDVIQVVVYVLDAIGVGVGIVMQLLFLLLLLFLFCGQCW